MGIKEASRTIIRRLEMLDIGNNFGKEKRCICGEKETTEHLIICENQKEKIQKEWIKETHCQ